jgi:hypothetical protein
MMGEFVGAGRNGVEMGRAYVVVSAHLVLQFVFRIEKKREDRNALG